MTTEQIYERVRQIVAWHARCCLQAETQAEHVRSDDVLSAHGIADELDCINLVIECEERINIDLPDDLVIPDMTVGDLVERIAQRLREQDQIEADAEKANLEAEQEYAARTRAAELGLNNP